MVAYDHDPVLASAIDSLGRPGGNITGILPRQLELAGKRLELLTELLPGLSRVAVFWDALSRQKLAGLQPAARALRLRLDPIELSAAYDFPSAFQAAKKKQSGAVMVLFSPEFYLRRAEIAAAAIESGLPLMSQDPDFAHAGAVISYAPDREEVMARVAYFIYRLLKGVKPSELPMEQLTRFKLVVNLKTARALGMTIPESILLRAHEVIR